MRHTTFTALMSISFILPGLALQAPSGEIALSIFSTTTNQLVFLLGYIFYCFSVFHYWWYHRYSHIYRRELKRLESSIGIEIYRHRVRPHLGRMKLHFDWALYIIAVIYGCITGLFVGWLLFGVVIGAITICYFMLMLSSIPRRMEPLEKL